MFDKLKKTYFGDRLVGGVEEIPEKSRIIVTFADNKKPVCEEMHKDEWEAGATEKPMEKPEQKQEWFVNRTNKIRKAVIDLVISHNPRFADMKKIIGWIDEGINMTYRGVVSKVFGLDNFDTEATVNLLVSKHELPQEELLKDWTQSEKDVFAILCRDGIKVNEITTQAFFGKLQSKIETIISESVAHALGGTDEARRCDDFEKILRGDKIA